MSGLTKWQQMEKENEVFRQVFHYINNLSISSNNDKIRELISAISSWSYAHHCGDGQLTDEQQQDMVDQAFDKIKQIVRVEIEFAKQIPLEIVRVE